MNNSPNMMNPNIMQMLGRLRQNPVQFLMERKFNIPANVSSDPNAIIQHLLKTNQISQDQINKAYQMMGQFKR